MSTKSLIFDEISLLMKGPLVLATLADRKTITRRHITRRNALHNGSVPTKAQWDALDWTSKDIFVDPGPSPAGNPGPYLHVQDKDGDCIHRIYPRVQPGTKILVRENFFPDAPINGDDAWFEEGQPLTDTEWNGNGRPLYAVPKKFRTPEHCIYAASWDDGVDLVWRPSIHMPRWACRLTLEVTKVRIERLQDISDDDCIAEGVDNTIAAQFVTQSPMKMGHCEKVAFAGLWESINGPGSWARKDWLFVYEYRRIKP